MIHLVPVIDSHTHCYPREVAKDPRAWGLARNERHWVELVAPENKKSLQSWASPEEMLAAMDAAGVDQAVLLGWYWEDEDTCRWHNEVIAEWVKEAPARFIGFAAVHPSGDVPSQLKAAQELGLKGVGELHFGVQGFNSTSAGWQSLAEWCAAKRWPVVLHATEAAGVPQAGSVPTPLMEFVQMAETQKDLKIILAHYGGGLPFFAMNRKLGPVLKNVYYDTAASPLLYKPEVLRKVIDLVGADHVLFGSDYPLRVYPRESSSPSLDRQVSEIRGLFESESEAAAIMGGNIAALLP